MCPAMQSPNVTAQLTWPPLMCAVANTRTCRHALLHFSNRNVLSYHYRCPKGQCNTQHPCRVWWHRSIGIDINWHVHCCWPRSDEYEQSHCQKFCEAGSEVDGHCFLTVWFLCLLMIVAGIEQYSSNLREQVQVLCSCSKYFRNWTFTFFFFIYCSSFSLSFSKKSQSWLIYYFCYHLYVLGLSLSLNVGWLGLFVCGIVC